MSNLQPLQFHEMTRDEFEAQPGTFFHGTPTGVVGSGGTSFHVGTRRAALEAVSARAGKRVGPYPTDMKDTITKTSPSGSTYSYQKDTDETLENTLKNRAFSGKSASAGGILSHAEITAPDPKVFAGRITAPMVNAPYALGSYGKGDYGDMNNSGDVLANGVESRIRSRGQQMKQGIYYRNVAEDSGSVSAIVPNREGFKTHEDYLVQARAQGKKIPSRALSGYTEIPGQQKMVF